MKYKIVLLRSFAFSLLILMATASATLAQNSRFQGNKEARQFTQKLPAIDKVELLKLKTDGDLWQGEIETTKTLKGVKAKNFATLWRNQVYRPYASACHNPAYGIKFYSGDKLIVFVSVCWDCNTIGFEKPYINNTQYFDGRGKQGQQLLRIFTSTFPEK
jgi:hypothetical protein